MFKKSSILCVCPYLHVSHFVLLMVYHGGISAKPVNNLCLTLRILLGPSHSDMAQYQILTRVSLVYFLLKIRAVSLASKVHFTGHAL
jgi:hypothetical protein